jgi:cytochrome b
VCFFFLAYLIEGGWRTLHTQAGYTVLLLVVFRIMWGVIGDRHARFRDFVTGPVTASVYLKQLLVGKSRHYEGHDPAGGLMIIVLLISLLLTAFTGMSLVALEGAGPLVFLLNSTIIESWSGSVLEKTHAFFANFTVTLVFVHVTGVIVTSILHKQNLILAMITGRKKRLSESSTADNVESEAEVES